MSKILLIIKAKLKQSLFRKELAALYFQERAAGWGKVLPRMGQGIVNRMPLFNNELGKEAAVR